MRRQWTGGLALVVIASVGVLLVINFGEHTAKVDMGSIPPPLERAVDFSTEVVPILQAHCVDCHGPEKKQGDLRLDTREWILRGGVSGPVIVLGRSDVSPLILQVLGLGAAPIMPPPKNDPLDRDQVRILRTWIDLGAPP